MADKVDELIVQYIAAVKKHQATMTAYRAACIMQTGPDIDCLLLECTATLEVVLDLERAVCAFIAKV